MTPGNARRITSISLVANEWPAKGELPAHMLSRDKFSKTNIRSPLSYKHPAGANMIGFNLYNKHPVTELDSLQDSVNLQTTVLSMRNARRNPDKRNVGKLSPLNAQEFDEVGDNQVLEKEMNETKKRMQETLYQLSRLVEGGNSLSKVIQGGDPTG